MTLLLATLSIIGGIDVFVRNSNGIFVIVLIIGAIGLAMVFLLQVFRSPYLLIVSLAAILLGLVGILDRRTRLALTDGGVRYARWGSDVFRWEEFSAFRRVTWRNSTYLQLVPLVPSSVQDRFSLLGKLSHRMAGSMGIPEFAIALTPLAISDAQLVDQVSQYLPEAS